MAELFGDDVFNELRSVAGDIMDTFAKRSIILSYSNVSSTFSRDGRTTPKPTEQIIPAVIVWHSDSEKGEVIVNKQGKSNISEGYCLIKYTEFEDRGLLYSEGSVNLDEGNSNILVDGINCEVLQYSIVGQAGDKYVLVKIPFKKKLNNA